MKFTIYKYTCPENKVYIGLTINPKNRKRDHKRKEVDLKDTTKFAKAIRKFGFESFKYEEIEYPQTADEMREREKYWIKMFNSKEQGYNTDDGGSWTQEFKHKAELVDNIVKDLQNDHLTQSEIAEKYNVSPSWVSGIKNGYKRIVHPIHRTNRQSQKGSSNPSAKLTEAQVIEIRSQLSQGVSRRELQQKYNVSKTLIQMIATEQTWDGASSDYQYKRKEVNGNAKLNEDIVRQIKLELKTDTQVNVAQKYGISRSTIQQIVTGKTWRNVVI